MYCRFIFIFLFSSITSATEIKPFTSDGCSAFPDGTFSQQSLWSNCCFLHDLAYWKGGTEAQKKTADYKLKLCVENVGEPAIAKLMVTGVQLGGSPAFNTPFRWGYGWPFGRGYEPLSRSDKLQVKQKLNRFKLLIDQEVKQLSLEISEDE